MNTIKNILREQARDKYRNLSEEEKKKREYMEKIDILICLKKTKKIIVRLKSLNIIINKIFLIVHAVIYAN